MRASRCCARWVGTPSACRRRTPRSRTAAHPREIVEREHRRDQAHDEDPRLGDRTTGRARCSTLRARVLPLDAVAVPAAARDAAWPTGSLAPVNWCPNCTRRCSRTSRWSDGRCERCGAPVGERGTSSSGSSRSPTTPTGCSTTSTRSDWPERVISRCSATGSAGPRAREVTFALDGLRRAASPSSPRGPTRSSARRSSCSRPSTRSSPSSPARDRAGAEIREYVRHDQARSAPRSGPRPVTKTGVFTGALCRQPGQRRARCPIWVADYVLMDYGTGAIMAVPGARRARLRVRREVRPADRVTVVGPAEDRQALVDDGVTVNSGSACGLNSDEARDDGDWLAERGRARP